MSRPKIAFGLLAVLFCARVAFLAGWELSVFENQYWVVRASENYTELDSGRKSMGSTAASYSSEGEQSPDLCTLADVVCSNEDITSMIQAMFPEDPETAVAIAKAESGMRAHAIGVNRNGTKDAGLYQINDIHGYSLDERLNPYENVKIARKLYDKHGWTCWSAYTNKSYQKFLIQ